MWVITVYADDRIKMYEFEDEKEAKESIQNMKGRKVLSHVIYFNDQFIEAAS
ncbi:MAG TPA: hypothetical protein VEY70_21230 [Metabacillus sp.]|nr:hypothetical protein [Metabacillus sp.]